MAVGTHAYAIPVGTNLGESPIRLSNASFNLDVNEDEVTDLGFDHVAHWFQEPGYIYSYHWAQAAGQNGAELILPSPEGIKEALARRFASGELIGPPYGVTGPLGAAGGLASYYRFSSAAYGPYGPYSGGQFGNERGFLGFKFDIDGQEHWGWVEAEVLLPPDSVCCAELRIYGWGYETEAETGILAGAPEPGTLAALAIGAAAVLGRRRTGGG